MKVTDLWEEEIDWNGEHFVGRLSRSSEYTETLWRAVDGEYFLGHSPQTALSHMQARDWLARNDHKLPAELQGVVV